MLAELAIIAFVLLGVGIPHAFPLERVAPLYAAALWGSALLLRAVVAAGGAVFLFVYLPGTRVSDAVARWCLHQVMPLLATHLGLSGHPVAHAAIVLPALALAASVMWLLVGLARAWLVVRRDLGAAVGEGPDGSTVIDQAEVLIALTAFGRPRIVVSVAALKTLDQCELRASLAHEQGHLQRRHRPLLMAASLLAALGRPLPGTRRAEAELAFQLERDADEFAVRKTRDPLALASAICKVAQSRTPLVTGLAGRGRVAGRLEILLDGGAGRSALLGRLAAALAGMLAAGAVGIAASVPQWTAPPSSYASPAGAGEQCHHRTPNHAQLSYGM